MKYIALSVVLFVILLPRASHAQFIERRTDFSCDSFTVTFDFFAEDATPSWKQVRVFVDDALVFQQDLDGASDVLAYYTHEGTLPADTIITSKLYKQRPGGRSNTIDQEDLRLNNRPSTCPTPLPTIISSPEQEATPASDSEPIDTASASTKPVPGNTVTTGRVAIFATLLTVAWIIQKKLRIS